MTEYRHMVKESGTVKLGTSLGYSYASPLQNAQELNKVLQIWAVAFKERGKEPLTVKQVKADPHIFITYRKTADGRRKAVEIFDGNFRGTLNEFTEYCLNILTNKIDRLERVFQSIQKSPLNKLPIKI